MKYEDLIKWCRRTCKSYNPVIDTIDSHADRYLKKVNIHLFNNHHSYRFKMIMKEFLLNKFSMVMKGIKSLF